eukprot:gb/GECG01004876.1/.p1 GENE.gb/GECG01004876.1/~~gb/GECG01004876.1/.p1  ORF type:complete len:492 (+),score=61.94 gb/GECG01004876.1/:1-1476(+)
MPSGSGSGSLAVLRPLYKQLLTLAWRFDAQPSLKALIHVHPFGKKSDKNLLQLVLPGSKVMYWPSSKGGNRPVCITELVRHKFRETETKESQSDRISAGFRALRFLNERISFARHLGLIGTVESLPNTKYLKSRSTTEVAHDTEPFQEEELPREGHFLLAHPQVSDPFNRKLIYLSDVSETANGEVVGMILNEEQVVRRYNLHGNPESGERSGNDSDATEDQGSASRGGRRKAVWKTTKKPHALVDQISKNRRRQHGQPTASDGDVEKRKRGKKSKMSAQMDRSYSQFTRELEGAQQKFTYPRRKFHSDSSMVERLPVYSGGPVTSNTFCMFSPRVLGLQGTDELDSSTVPDLLERVDRKMLTESVNSGDTGLFGSIALWSREQLLKELSLGYWIIVSHPHLYDVFRKCTQSKMEDHSEESDRTVRTRPSTRMWEECLKSLGSEFAAFTEIPDVELASHEKAPEDYQPDEQALRSLIFEEDDDNSSGSRKN